MKKEPGSTAQYFLLIKELKDEVCILERQRRDIFCSRKIFANEFMASNFWNIFILGDLNYFTSGCILTIVKTCVLVWICNLIIALNGGCAHSRSLSRDVLLYGPLDEVSLFFV